MLLLLTRSGLQCPRLRPHLPRPTLHCPTSTRTGARTQSNQRLFNTINRPRYSAYLLRALSRTSRPKLAPILLSPSTMIQLRAHAGHSHSHGHSQDNAYLVSANRNDAGVKITRIGLYVNLGMAVTKGVGGWLFNSQALIADAFHALTDLVSDFMTLATISWSLRPPTERFPTGYGKIESLGALGVSGLLILGGLGMGMNGVDALYIQFLADHSHGEHVHGLFGIFGHGHSHSHLPPSLNAAWLAAGSIAVKEWLYRATMKIAKERRSSVLASNAVHHRVDSLTSIVALMTIAGSHFIESASWLDPVGGLIISIMVIRAGWSNTYASLLELADVTVDDELKAAVRKSANKALRGNVVTGLQGAEGGEHVDIEDVQGIKSGQNYLVDIDLAVPSTFTVSDTVPIEKAVRERLGREIRGIRRVRVKFTTKDDDQSFASEFVGPDVNPQSLPEPIEEDHDHDHVQDHATHHGHQHSNDRQQEDKKLK